MRYFFDKDAGCWPETFLKTETESPTGIYKGLR